MMRGRGFTLIEIVVAATLLAVATIVALGSLPTLSIVGRRARFRVQALQICQTLVDRQRAQSWAALPALPHQEVLPAQLMPDTGTSFEPVLRWDKVDGYDPEQLRRLTVTISWKERDRRQSVQQETMLSHVPRF